MNKTTAKNISETITNQELSDMFDNAKSNINNWTKRSSVNPGMTIGTTWNILAGNFDINKVHLNLAKRNMIWEFGDYLPNNILDKYKKEIYSAKNIIPHHQEPKF